MQFHPMHLPPCRGITKRRQASSGEGRTSKRVQEFDYTLMYPTGGGCFFGTGHGAKDGASWYDQWLTAQAAGQKRARICGWFSRFKWSEIKGQNVGPKSTFALSHFRTLKEEICDKFFFSKMPNKAGSPSRCYCNLNRAVCESRIFCKI